MTARVTWTGEQWARSVVPAINAGLTAGAAVLADGTHAMLEGPSPSAPWSPPGWDTGNLARSIRFVSPEAAGTPLKAHVGTAEAYGRHLEFGAYITPKRSKYLAVPVDRLLAAKFTKGRIGGSLKGVPGLKYVPPGKGKNHGGRLVLTNSVRVNVRGAKRSSRGVARGQTVFVLKKAVVLQPRPWITRAMYAYAPEVVAKAREVTKARLMAEGLVTP